MAVARVGKQTCLKAVIEPSVSRVGGGVYKRNDVNTSVMNGGELSVRLLFLN